MNVNQTDQIALRDRLILGLEREMKLKNELLAEQKTMIRILEEHNAELTKLIERFLQNEENN